MTLLAFPNDTSKRAGTLDRGYWQGTYGEVYGKELTFLLLLGGDAEERQKELGKGPALGGRKHWCKTRWACVFNATIAQTRSFALI